LHSIFTFKEHNACNLECPPGSGRCDLETTKWPVDCLPPTPPTHLGTTSIIVASMVDCKTSPCHELGGEIIAFPL